MYHKLNKRACFIICITAIFIKNTEGNKNLNIMILNSADNIYIESGVDDALNYIQNLPDLEVYFNCVLRVNSQDNMNGQLFLDYICEMYEEAVDQNCSPDLVLDLTVDREMSEAAKTFSSSLNIPTVAAAHAMYGEIRPWDSLDSSKWLNMVQVSPPANVMLQIIEQISSLQKMKNVAIMYDQFFRMDTVTQSLLGNAAIRQVLVKVEDPEELRRQMTELRELDIVNYYILGSLHTAKQVLDCINHDYYYKTKFAWHIITQDEGSLRCVCKNITVLVIRPVSKRIVDHTTSLFHDHRYISDISFSFYRDLTIRSVLSLLSLLKETNISKIENNFPKCSQEGQLTASSMDFRTRFEKIEQQFDYGPIVLGNNWTGTMDFEMRLDLVATATLHHKVIGYWSSKDRELFVFENISSLAAKPIYKVAVIVLPPFTMVSKDENGNENYTGYCIDLIDEISQMLGFEYEIYKVPDNTPGTMDENGKWSGIVKEVLEKRADIGLSSMSVTAERQDVVEFTMPFYDLIGMNILMKKAKPSTAFFKFFSAMGSDVWFCIILVYIIASALIWTFEQFSLLISQGYHKQLWGTEDKREFTIKECLWFCMTSLTPQGGGEGLSTSSGRVVAAVWWLFGFILLSSYTANLAAFLTVSRLDTSINSLEDLAKQYKVQYAPMNGSQGQTYFQRMAAIEAKFQREWMNLVLKENMSVQGRSELAVWDYPAGDKFTKMWKAMQEAGLPMNLQVAVDRVLASKSSTEGFAFIADANALKWYTSTNCDLKTYIDEFIEFIDDIYFSGWQSFEVLFHDKLQSSSADGNLVKYYSMKNCDLQVVGEEFCKLALAIILQKNSPLTQIINRALAILLHKRRLNQLKEKWWDENPDRKICPEQDELTEGISIYNIGGVFVVMASGTLLACIILFFEYCCPKQIYMRRQSKKNLTDHLNISSGNDEKFWK